IEFILQGLHHFKEISGLSANTDKSSIFFCNTSSSTRSFIISLTYFRQDALPVKYLSLPLISSRLTKHHCSPLIDKMMARANSWVSNSLSYAGRLQLIKSTLASMQIICSSSFLLPATVMMECERILHRFLWGGNGSVFKESLVKWANVC
ncbi:hypothetical protein CFOL_v3_31992, partial [Cephalotus follicularis]